LSLRLTRISCPRAWRSWPMTASTGAKVRDPWPEIIEQSTTTTTPARSKRRTELRGTRPVPS
jgi:hypothetical protein